MWRLIRLIDLGSNAVVLRCFLQLVKARWCSASFKTIGLPTWSALHSSSAHLFLSHPFLSVADQHNWRCVHNKDHALRHRSGALGAVGHRRAGAVQQFSADVLSRRISSRQLQTTPNSRPLSFSLLIRSSLFLLSLFFFVPTAVLVYDITSNASFGIASEG